MGRRELRRQEKRRWDLIEGGAGLGAVGGFLLTMQSGFAAADLERCSAGPDDAFSSCIVHRLLQGAGAIAPTVIALALLAGAMGWALGRIVYAPPSKRPGARLAAVGRRRPARASSATLAAVPTPERVRILATMPYRAYLRTPEWRRTRALMLERAGHHCQLDARHTTDLEVHHTTYERRGHELPSDLTVLCRACHAGHHRRQRAASAPALEPAPVPDPAPQPAPDLATPFVVPLDWTPPAPPPRPSLLRRLLAR